MPDAGLPAELSRADPAALVASIRAGVPFMALPDGPEQDAAVEEAVTALHGEPVAFVRVGNPLRSPLSLERLVFQLTPEHETGAPGDPAERVWLALLAQGAGYDRLVLLVSQAETLTVPALVFLQGLPGLRQGGVPPVQIVFTGTPGFRALLADDRLHVLRDALDAPSSRPVSPGPGTAPPAGKKRAGKKRAGTLLFAGAGAVVAAGAALAVLLPGRPRDSTVQAADSSAPVQPALVPALEPPSPAPSPAPPPPSQAASSAAADAAPAEPLQAPAPSPESPEEARTRLYRAFTAFLQERGMAARLSRADREALFQDYLARHRGAATEPDLPRIAATVHVVLMVPPGSAPSQALAEREADLFRKEATDVAVRPAPEAVAAPAIRYFFPGDRASALSLARAVPAPGGEWRVEDMTAESARPDPGTVEVWLPP